MNFGAGTELLKNLLVGVAVIAVIVGFLFIVVSRAGRED